MGRLNNRQEQTDRRKVLRQDATEMEQKLWYALSRKQMEGFKFRRQHGIGAYIVDFYCPRLKLVVEIDGDSHFTPAAERYDAHRDVFLRSQGVRILRFTNLDVKLTFDGVIEDISRWIALNREDHENPSGQGSRTEDHP